MSTQMQTAQKGTIRAWLERQDVIDRADSALGGWMDGNQFINQLIISFSDPKLEACTEQSKYNEAMKCVALALLPSMQHVALIPRENRREGIVECTSMVQWQGLQSLMCRHPHVLEVEPHLVHVTDSYQYDINRRTIHDHRFDPFDSKRKFDKLEEVKGGYLIIRYRDGRPELHHFVTADDIKKARACAQTQNIWNAWFKEMCLKTLFRNAFNRRAVPIDPLVNTRLNEAFSHEDVMLANDPARVQIVSTPEPKQLSRAEQLALQSRSEPLDVPAPQRRETVPAETKPGPPAESKAKKATKKKAEQTPEPEQEEPKPAQRKKADNGPPPDIGNHLRDYASAIHAAGDAEAIEDAFEQHVNSNGSLSDTDYEACCELRDWKYRQLGLEPPKHVTEDGQQTLY